MYIVFEGIDGAGKSTQIQMLKDWLEANGFRVETVVEPTESKIRTNPRLSFQTGHSSHPWPIRTMPSGLKF